MKIKAAIRKTGIVLAVALFSWFCALATNATQAIAQVDTESAPLWQCNGVLVRIIGPLTVAVGAKIDYQIQITNNGSCNLTSAQLKDYLPRSTIYISATPVPAIHPDAPSFLEFESVSTPPINQIQWNDLHMTASDFSATYEAILEVQATAGSTITNTACVEHPQTGRICDELDTYVTPKPY